MTQDHSLLAACAAGFFHCWRLGLLGALLLFIGTFLAACGKREWSWQHQYQ
jgi:hypothetical protein